MPTKVRRNRERQFSGQDWYANASGNVLNRSPMPHVRGTVSKLTSEYIVRDFRASVTIKGYAKNYRAACRRASSIMHKLLRA